MSYKNYLLFKHYEYDSKGGLSHIVFDFNTYKEWIEYVESSGYAKDPHIYGNFQLFDCTTRNILALDYSFEGVNNIIKEIFKEESELHGLKLSRYEVFGRFDYTDSEYCSVLVLGSLKQLDSNKESFYYDIFKIYDHFNREYVKNGDELNLNDTLLWLQKNL